MFNFTSSIHHSFDTKLASLYGVDCAILIHHFQHWIRINRAHGRNIEDGRCWTYQTRKQIQAYFPYWTEKQIRKITEKLVDLSILITGKYNKESKNHTLWYAFADEISFGVDEASILETKKLFEKRLSVEPQNSKNVSDLPKRANRFAQTGKSIQGTDTKTSLKEIVVGDTDQKTRDGRSNSDRGGEKILKQKNVAIAPHHSSPLRQRPPPISLNLEKREFNGISQEDIKSWKEKFPNLDIDREIKLCAEWAFANPRKNYRRSILSWLVYVSKNPAKEHKELLKPEPDIDKLENRKMVINNYKKKYWKQLASKELYLEHKVDHVLIGNDKLYFDDGKFEELWKHYARKYQLPES